MAEAIRTTGFSKETINTGEIKNHNFKKPFNPEKDEELQKNIVLGTEELEEKKKKNKRNALAVTIIVILIIIVIMFGFFAA